MSQCLRTSLQRISVALHWFGPFLETEPNVGIDRTSTVTARPDSEVPVTMPPMYHVPRLRGNRDFPLADCSVHMTFTQEVVGLIPPLFCHILQLFKTPLYYSLI